MNRLVGALVAAPLLALACSSDVPPADGGSDELTSKTATFLEFRFHAQVVAPHADGDAARRKAIVSQLFYLSGELDKAHGGHGRFNFATLSNVTAAAVDDALDRIDYDAVVP